MTFQLHRGQRLAFTLLVLGSVTALGACGYSQDEWDAQLAKYEQLSREYEKCSQRKPAVDGSPGVLVDAPSCVVDKDCSDELICEAGTCRAPKR